jgi:quercetin dioxygenase-like cupin family protein
VELPTGKEQIMERDFDRVKIVPPGAGKTRNVLGETATSILTGEDTGGAYAVGEQVNLPGGGPPLHKHHREDEGFYILEGEYDFHVGDRVIRASPGTYLFAPRGIPHTFRCVGPGRGRLQVTITPAGLERFFEELSALASAGPPEMGAFIALAQQYELEILGPPPGG